MLKVTQTVMSSGGESPERAIGNCLSAVMASLLHLNIEDVPTFDAPTFALQVKQLNAWLKKYGLAYVYSIRDHQLVKGSGCHHELHGRTERFNGKVCHSTVAIDGEMVWDPHPSHSGLTTKDGEGYLVCLEPWKVAELYSKAKS
jgi:hypothetical protein